MVVGLTHDLKMGAVFCVPTTVEEQVTKHEKDYMSDGTTIRNQLKQLRRTLICIIH